MTDEEIERYIRENKVDGYGNIPPLLRLLDAARATLAERDRQVAGYETAFDAMRAPSRCPETTVSEFLVEWWESSPWSPLGLRRLSQDHWTTRMGRWLCECGGHSPGVVWYSMSENLEPDMHCKRCGTDCG